mgnify:CR=1 FL=1
MRNPTAGHTAEVTELDVVHSGPYTASRLIIAAQNEGLDPDHCLRALRALSKLQERSPGHPQRGCLRWYHEETAIKDTNAAFFVGLNLLVLHHGYAEKLDEAAVLELHSLFEHLDAWFDRSVGHGSMFYPNKYLGDLVCAWLLKEALRRKPGDDLISAMQEAGGYWRDEHWGWGEHLSEMYAPILLDELGCLLLLARSLPEEIRALYLDLFRELLEINDFHGGGKRVPMIRSYGFTTAGALPDYRDKIVPQTEVFSAGEIKHPGEWPRMFPFGSYLLACGWRELAGKPPLSPGGNASLVTPCYGGVRATAFRDGDFRLGSLSRFPHMPHLDKSASGLSWQSFPVAFCGDGRDYGFLRWRTVLADGEERCHPATNKNRAYLRNALTEAIRPPVVGETFAWQAEDRLIVLRRMPRIATDWRSLGDGWDLYDWSGEVLESDAPGDGWSRLLLRMGGGREIQLWHHELSEIGAGAPRLHVGDGELHWRVEHTEEALQPLDHTVRIWLLAPGGSRPPVLRETKRLPRFRHDYERVLSWPDHPVEVRLNPWAETGQLRAD